MQDSTEQFQFGDTRLPDRFWAKVALQDDGCWSWTASKNRDGYGQFKWDEKAAGAHRLSYITFYGEPAKGYHTDHKCHNRACVNPHHLQSVPNHVNLQNRAGLDKSNTSGYRGVSWHGQNKVWRARATHQGKLYVAGYFEDIEEANQAAIALRNRLHSNNLLDRQVD